jgi:hypothetical protein
MAPEIEVPVVPELVAPLVHEKSVQWGHKLVAKQVVRYIAVNTVNQGMAAEVTSTPLKILKAAIMDLLHCLDRVIVPKMVVKVVHKVSALVGPRLQAVLLGQ